MEKNIKSRSEKFWDRTASSYDREERNDGKTFRQIIEQTKGYLKPTDTLLDFGCGTGSFSIELAASVSNICAIDISSKMVEIANTKAAAASISNVECLHTTIFDDRLEAGTYDVVLAFYILHLVENPQTVIARIKELLKPEGLIISVTPCMGEKSLLKGLFQFLSLVKLTPPITSFKWQDLEKLLDAESLGIVENKKLANTSNQYFIVARK